MQFKNRETEQVAQAIWNADDKEREAWKLNIASLAPVRIEDGIEILAGEIKAQFVGDEFRAQSQERIEFAEVLAIDYGLVDWRQVAQWLLENTQRPK